MDRLNKEKIVFTLSLALVAYALVFVFVNRTAPIGDRNILPQKSPDIINTIQWGTDKILIAGHFGNFFKGGRDPFQEKDLKQPKRRITLPPYSKPGRLKPVPSFIGAPPRLRESSRGFSARRGGYWMGGRNKSDHNSEEKPK